jgi:AcrR family transcriptional regulator
MSSEEAVPRLVEATIRLLAEEGPAQIKARSVADAAGVSTQALYYHLGGLPELLQAVIDRGFSDLSLAFASLTKTSDPVSDLFAMALTSRRFARENPHLYDAMFGLSTRGSYRAPHSQGPRGEVRSAAFQAAYDQLVGACRRVVEVGRVDPGVDADVIASQLWSAVHGFITLELGGHFDQLPDPVRQVLEGTTVNILVGLGDDRSITKKSHDRALGILSIN